MRLAREYHTPIDYFLSVPIHEFGEIIDEHNRIVEELKASHG